MGFLWGARLFRLPKCPERSEGLFCGQNNQTIRISGARVEYQAKVIDLHLKDERADDLEL
jgi:hypothetical protein